MISTIEELKAVLNVPTETPQLEFKKAENGYDQEKLYGYCVAIANEGGGELILGVTDRKPRSIIGTRAFINISKIEEQLFNKLKFRVLVRELFEQKKRILVFQIPGRPRGTAYALEGKYLMRAGESLVPMSEDKLRTIFDEGKPDWLEENYSDGFSGQDIVQLLDTQAYFDLMELPYPSSQDGVLDRLKKEGLISTQGNIWKISNLATVLLAKDLKKFPDVARKAIRVVRYESDNKLKTLIDQVWAKGYAVGFSGLIEFVTALLPQNEVIGAAFRKEVKMFPDEAVRELVANALVHQDFSLTGTSVMIEIYDNRLEISNPGIPYIETDRFIDEYRSRNERLANFMRRMKICEEKGSGIDRVLFTVEAFQLPAPDFRVDSQRTAAILFGHQDFKSMEKKDRIRAAYQHSALQYVMHRRMSNQSLRKRFKLPESKAETVSRIIRDTLSAGKIKSEDETASRKYARYVPYWA